MTANKENEIFRKKFRASGFDKVEDFRQAVKSELTKETYTAVIYRDKPMSLESMLKMAADMAIDPPTIHKLLKDRGQDTIARFFAKTDLTTDELRLLDKLRKINDKSKLKLVEDMLDTLGG